MTITIIPFFSDPSWTTAITLEGTLYNFEFDYNERGACWYMSVADADGVDIANGVKLVTGFPLLRKCKDPRRPGWQPATGVAGDFFVQCTTSDLTPPGLYDLLAGSGRCSLAYVSSDWVAILQTQGPSALLAQAVAGSSTTSPLSTYGTE